MASKLPVEFTPASPEEPPGEARPESSALAQAIDFEPVKLRPRHDGWTAERQTIFIETLAETACVEQACRSAGMTPQSAYRLRRLDFAATFRRTWDNALDCALHRLEHAALSRALHGVARPVFYKGEQVGEWRDYDERLTMFMLRHRRPQRFGRWIERELSPQPPESEPAYRLSGDLDDIEWGSPIGYGPQDEEE